MSKGLQALIDEAGFAEIRRLAAACDLTVAEWVRQALQAAKRHAPSRNPERKLAAIREAAALDLGEHG